MDEELNDLTTVARGFEPFLRVTGESPVRFAGRVMGLGTAEMDAGVPKWAWVGVGVVAGAVGMWFLAPALKGIGAKRKSS